MTENVPRTEAAPRAETTLESWKAIAAYLKRDVSTLKRWEKSEGLPVHRHRHRVRSSVYAHPSELDDWWARRRPVDDTAATPAWTERRPPRALGFAVTLLLALAAAGDGLVLRPSAASVVGTVSRLLWTGPLVDVLGAPSPDGTYLAVTDWETGNLAVRDIASGTLRRLTDNGNWRGWAEFPVPSPDGKRIAYAWFNERAQRDLRVYSLETSAARVVYACDEVDYPQPFAWTPDGSRILVGLARSDQVHQIALVDVGDGSARILKTLDWRSPQKLALSPDGRYVAYDFPQRKDSKRRDIFLLAADGSGDGALVEHPDNDVVLGWAPDGRRLLFGSDRSGRLGIWAQAAAEGRALGGPELVRADVPLLRAMGVTRAGALYYSVRTGVSDVYTATLDARIGAVVAPPAPLTPRYVGWNRSPDWSADGRFVAYVSQRDAPPLSVGSMGGTIVVRALETGDEREITPRLATMGTQVRWSPDGRFFLAHGRDATGTGFFKLSAETGEAELVVRDEPGYVQSPVWSPDSRRLFYLRTTPGADRRLRVRNLDTGEDRGLVSRSTNNLALSPDGRALVVRFGEPGEEASVLAIVPASGGEAKELLRVVRQLAFPSWSGLAWTPDARHILFTQTNVAPAPQPFELWRIAVSGGTPQRTGIAMEGLRNLRVHPDGQRIVFSAGQNQDEVWVMEGFLGEPAAAR